MLGVNTKNMDRVVAIAVGTCVTAVVLIAVLLIANGSSGDETTSTLTKRIEYFDSSRIKLEGTVRGAFVIVSLWTIDDHQYIITGSRRADIIHAASCPCRGE